jgi:hypothetical protein
VAVGHELARLGALEAKPMRKTTLSSRISSMRSRFSPVIALALVRLLEVVAELLLEDGVALAHLLLLAQLDAELAHLAAALVFMPGRRAAALEGALAAVAARALQEELQALATADAADGIGVSSHRSLRPGAASGGRQPLCGMGVTSVMA